MRFAIVSFLLVLALSLDLASTGFADLPDTKLSFWGAALAAVGGIAGSFLGGKSQERAAQAGANAQLASTQAQIDYQRELREITPQNPNEVYRVFDTNSQSIKYERLTGDDISKSLTGKSLAQERKEVEERSDALYKQKLGLLQDQYSGRQNRTVVHTQTRTVNPLLAVGAVVGGALLLAKVI